MPSRSRSRAATRTKPARARAPPRPLARALAAHPDRAAAACFALLVLAYLWPVLLGGRILSPISLLYGFPPWQDVAPDDLGSYLNTVLVDIPLADYPWRVLARELIHQGTLPAWDPRVFGGIPFFSNPQTGIFTPFSLPLWILPLNYGIGVSAALKLWVGGFGAYVLVRQLRMSFLPGLLAGVSFAFCSLNIVWLTHETLPAVAVMLPWMVWLVERIFERGRLGSAIALGVVTAIALGGGHPGMQLHVLLAAGLYVLLRAALLPAASWTQRLRPFAVAAGGLALGALLMALMLVPEALSSRGTLGTLARQGGRGSLPGTDMPLSTAKTLLFPDWWGRPTGVHATNPPLVNYSERTMYAGVVALLLAAVGLAARGDWRRKAPFALLALLGIAVPLHAPGVHWLFEQLPGFKLVQNQRLHFVFEFAVAVLAAFGLQAVLDRPKGDLRRLAVGAGAVVLAIAALGSAGASGSDAGHVLKHFLTGADFQSNGVLALTSVTWFLLLALGVGVALLVARRWPRRGYAAAAAVVLLAAGDMLHFAHGYQPMGPASKVLPPRTPVISFLQRHADEGRIVGLNSALPNDWSGTYGLRDVRGYDPPQPTVRFYQLWLSANPGQIDWQPFGIGELSATAARVVSVLGARYIVDATGAPSPARRDDPSLRGIRRVYAGKDATVFENPRAVPRAMVAATVELASDSEDARDVLVGEGFDARRTAVVERDQPGAAELSGGLKARGSVAVVHERNAQVTLRATLDRRGLVVLNDTLSDGWSVGVDGHAAQALHANDVMRGVVVGPGRHTIVWSYAVPGLRVGLVLSVLALLLAAGGGVALALRGRGRRGGLSRARV